MQYIRDISTAFITLPNLFVICLPSFSSADGRHSCVKPKNNGFIYCNGIEIVMNFFKENPVMDHHRSSVTKK